MATRRVGYWFDCPACRKRTYRSRKHARRAAHRAHPGHRLVAYRCPHHEGWHLGHPNPADRDRQRRQRTHAQHPTPARHRSTPTLITPDIQEGTTHHA